ncbi:RNA polymerase sigma-70 factor, ECF subfamily [Chitinophaga jiangningensis]|uniref:RNA polymerase sigma-70 factor, ECF subfamily n=1 Tax=Chitinophaga jiangningensis TaxID=1419482 RepID=A0A1M7FBU4_9BACT|nr:RNA polymerase sigma-70 factor, ECF subfamily [Chitinophaga jiangningensis]
MPADNKEEAFDLIYEENCGRIYNVLLSMTRDEAVAKDAFQETFVKVWHKMDTYDAEKGSVYNWIKTIARNTAVDMFRSGLYRSLPEFKPLGEEYLDLVTYDREYTGIIKVTDRLKPEHRIIIEMMYYRGRTLVEIANFLQVPLGTIKTRLTEARKVLRQILKKEH